MSSASLAALKWGPIALSRRRWEAQFPKLRRFHQEFGHADVPEGWADDPKLAHWVSAVRQRHRRGELDREKERALLGLDFSFEPRQQTWETMFRALVGFQARYGHTAVPRWWKPSQELGVWVTNLRVRYRARSKAGPELRQLPDDKVAALEALGFSWDLKKDFVRLALGALAKFKEQHGHVNVPPRCEVPRLNAWLTHARKLARNDKLVPADKAAFEALGFEFRARRARPAGPAGSDSPQRVRPPPMFGPEKPHRDILFFEARMRELAEFKARHGHCDVPSTWERRGKQQSLLARWVGSVRHRYKVGEVRPEQIRRLKAVGFEFAPFASQWETRFAELQWFQKRHGHCRVPRFWKKHPGLGGWVSNQRMDRRNGELLPERQERLESLGFTWDAHDAVWERRIAELGAWVKKNGHAFVSAKGNDSLHQWLQAKRRAFRAGTLPADEGKALKALGVEMRSGARPVTRSGGKLVVETLEERWNARLAELTRYQDKHGHSDVPRPGTLGKWVDRMRREHGAGKLSVERIAKLEAIGFQWACPRVRRGPAKALAADPNVDALARFKRDRGHLHLTPVDDRRLGVWVLQQRANWRLGRIDEGLKAALARLEFPVRAEEVEWERMFSLALDFQRRSTGRQPADDLTRWLSRQRELKANGRLDASREARLEDEELL